jgi:lysophospholipase L1-like esterase
MSAILALAAGLMLGAAPLAPAAAPGAPATTAAAPATGRGPRVTAPADQPAIKPGAGFLQRHEQYVALAKKGGIDLYFEGDSITDGWHGKKTWDTAFGGWKAGNFGIGGDRTEHVLWRLQNGELDGVSPKAFVIMIGTNNVGTSTPEQVAAGVTAIVKTIQGKNPTAHILLLAIFPRGAGPTDRNRLANDAANKIIAKLDDGKLVKYMDIGPKFLDDKGVLLAGTFNTDNLHPVEKGYQIWADAITPILTEWLGPPSAAGTASAPAK